MLFLMEFGRFPEKFSLGIFFSPSKPNTIRLQCQKIKLNALTVTKYEEVISTYMNRKMLFFCFILNGECISMIL